LGEDWPPGASTAKKYCPAGPAAAAAGPPFSQTTATSTVVKAAPGAADPTNVKGAIGASAAMKSAGINRYEYRFT